MDRWVIIRCRTYYKLKDEFKPVVSEEKMFEHVDGQMMDGRTPESLVY